MDATFRSAPNNTAISGSILEGNTTLKITTAEVTTTSSPTTTTTSSPTTTTTSSPTTTTTSSPTTTTTSSPTTTTTSSPTTTTTSSPTTTTTSSPTTTTTSSPTTTTTITSSPTTTTTSSPTTTTTSSPTTTTTSSPTTTTTSSPTTTTTTTSSPTTTTTTTSSPTTTTTSSPTTTTTSSPTTTTTSSPTTTTTTRPTTTTTTTTSSPTTTTTTTTAKPNTITTQTTTTTPTTTTTTTTVPSIVVQIVIIEIFVPQLKDPKSPEYETLATKVASAFNSIYKKEYGDRFIRTIVLGFIAVSKTRAEQNVQAEVELVFDQRSTEPIPSNTAIVETLKEAATASNSTFNLIVDTNTITVIKSLQKIPLTILTGGTFVAALSNTSSAAFQTRASTIKTGLEPFFFADYPASFSIITVTSFSDASVKTRSVPTIRNSMDLTFAANTLLPNSTQIVNTIVRAAKNNTLPFQIFTNEIMINGTAFSSAEVGSKISVLTALLLGAVSLLVPWFD